MLLPHLLLLLDKFLLHLIQPPHLFLLRQPHSLFEFDPFLFVFLECHLVVRLGLVLGAAEVVHAGAVGFLGALHLFFEFLFELSYFFGVGFAPYFID